MYRLRPLCVFFNDTATTEIYTLSLHDALPISLGPTAHPLGRHPHPVTEAGDQFSRVLGQTEAGDRELHDTVGRDSSVGVQQDRKSTRLNSSHANISYAVFCLKKTTTRVTSI